MFLPFCFVQLNTFVLVSTNMIWITINIQTHITNEMLLIVQHGLVMTITLQLKGCCDNRVVGEFIAIVDIR